MKFIKLLIFTDTNIQNKDGVEPSIFHAKLGLLNHYKIVIRMVVREAGQTNKSVLFGNGSPSPSVELFIKNIHDCRY